jgi:hypothetical protein
MPDAEYQAEVARHEAARAASPRVLVSAWTLSRLITAYGLLERMIIEEHGGDPDKVPGSPLFLVALTEAAVALGIDEEVLAGLAHAPKLSDDPR